MEEKKNTLVIEAHVENPEDAKELLDEIGTLLDKYDVTIDLKIYQCRPMLYTLT
ncbi:MAG: hypothetical protein RR496_06035 [Lachnospiraceae bacterium]